MDEVNDMDGKRLKEFITKRSTIWTLSFCMTGIIVLGGIASLERAQRGEVQQETEAVPGEQALADDLTAGNDNRMQGDMLEGSGEEQALSDGNADDLAVANADGMADGADGQTGADGNTDASVTENADGTADGSDGSGLGSGSAGMNESADGDAMAAANADGTSGNDTTDANGENQGTASGTEDGLAAANADGTADGSIAEDADAAEAASASIISEQTLIDNGVSYEAQGASLLWPAAGTILIDYSMDGSVYFPTLNQYKYNPALVIGSDTGNQVLAAAKGIVESAYVDEETGTTLVLNIGNGYKLTYGGLKELQAKEGDVLESGAVIGYVSEPTKYYSTEGSNVYFAMTKDGEPVDPVLYLE